MSWFNKKKEMNEQDLHNEEIIENDAEDFTANDKKRFNEDGEEERINIDIKDEPKEKVKSPEILRLENELNTAKARCDVAETKLVDVQKRFDEAKNNLERETAEMRARLTKTLEQRAQQGQFNFLTTLLPVLDNLNLAIDHAQNDSSLENLLGGVKGTARSFEKALTSVGVQPVASVGEKFDPEMHEAVDMIEVEPERDEEGNVVAEEPQPDPEMMKAQAELQIKQQEMEFKGEEAAMKIQLAGEEAAAELELALDCADPDLETVPARLPDPRYRRGRRRLHHARRHLAPEPGAEISQAQGNQRAQRVGDRKEMRPGSSL
jgi:molecular chaperone GrpE